MEDCGAHADQCCCEEQQGEGRRDRQQQQADEREDHSDGKRVGHRLAVGVVSDDRLKEGRGDLEGEGDEADLGEVEMEGCFEDGVDRGEERLHHVVEDVAEADGRQDAEHGFLFGCGGRICCLLCDGLSAHSLLSPHPLIVMLAILSASLLSRTRHSLSRTVLGTEIVRASPIV